MLSTIEPIANCGGRHLLQPGQSILSPRWTSGEPRFLRRMLDSSFKYSDLYKQSGTVYK